MLIKQQKSNGRACRQAGFSLVELLVVISIIAILSALLMANFMGARERARDAQKISDLESIKTALRMYYNDKQSYPSDFRVIATDGYIGSIPTDATYDYTLIDSDSYVLRVNLEAGAGDDDVNSQTKCGVEAVDKVFAVCAK